MRIKLLLLFLLPLTAALGLQAAQAAGNPLRLEAEAAQLLDEDVQCLIGAICEAELSRLTGPSMGSSIPGYSGSGYAAGFVNSTDRIEFTVQADRAGRFAVEIGYACESGAKIANLLVNGSSKPIPLDSTGAAWGRRRADTVLLGAGPNTLGISANWTHFHIDYVKLTPAGLPAALRAPPKTLADPLASAKARALQAWLVDRYGKGTLSGQQDISESGYVFSKTGSRPAILAGDFMRYSPSFISPTRDRKPQGITESYVDTARAGYLISMMWHWNAPTDLVDGTGELSWYKGFYAKATTFDLGAALADTLGEKYRLLISDMDSIALELKKFAAADIPVLWRPLHEAEGKWFWWGAKGPENLKKLWRIMHKRYTGVHGLHNLIWVFTWISTPEWYPGDDVVDVVGYDAYVNDLGDPLTSIWEDLKGRFNGNKLLALTEFGGAPDIDRMKIYGVTWSYFVSWTGDCCGPRKMTDTALNAIYRSPLILNRADIETASIYSTVISIRRSAPPGPHIRRLRAWESDLLGRRLSGPED